MTSSSSSSFPINLSRPGSPEYDGVSDTELFVSKALSKAREDALRKVELNGERNIMDGDSTMESASLPINLPRPGSPEYDEISDTEIDRFVSKPLDEDAVREMDCKFRVLKGVLEQIDDQKEKQRQFEVIYQEYAAWCETRIDSKVMMYFVHKFHTDCALYMREHHGIEVDVRRYENEIIRRTENPEWTDAQKLERRVLQIGESKSKKKICAQKVEDVFNELLAEEFRNVLACGPLSTTKISALVECSKSQRDFFSRTLCKYDKNGELPGLLDKVLVNQWISFFHNLPQNGFDESDTLSEYRRVRRDLPLIVSPNTHITFLMDLRVCFVEQKKTMGTMGTTDGNNSRNRFCFPKLQSIIRDSDEEKRKCETAQKQLLKQMNEQTQQQVENAREERKCKEMKEAQEDRMEREDERVRKEENDRLEESRKRQEKAEAEQREKEERERAERNKGLIRKAWRWIY